MTVPVWNVLMEKGACGVLCVRVGKAHTKEQILVIFNINTTARQQSLPFPHSVRPYSRLWRRQGRSGVGPYSCFLAAAATTIFRTKKLLGDRNEGSTAALEQNEVPYVPSFIRECMTGDGKTYLNLQPPATLTCRGWISVSSALGKLGLPGPGCWLVLFLPLGLAETYHVPCVPKRKDRNKMTRTRPLC